MRYNTLVSIPPQAGKEETKMANEKILVVDDDKNICELLRLYLVKEGYNVTMVHDGGAALAEFDKLHPDLVLLDVMMPVMDGLEATRRIRALEHPDAGTVTILAMTAQSSADSIHQCEQSGMNGYIAKPVEAAELIKILSEKCPKGCKN